MRLSIKTEVFENAVQSQPRPQGLLLVQNGGSEKPLTKAAELYSKNRGVFCHVTHDEMAFAEVISGIWRPCLHVFCNLKPLLKRNEEISSCLPDKILANFRSHFGSLGQGFFRSSILNEEKALGTRLLQSRGDEGLSFWCGRQ